MLDILSRAIRKVRICAILVLRKLRKEDLRRTRWWHAVKVVERLVARLNLAVEG